MAAREKLSARTLSLVAQYTEPEWKRELRREISDEHVRWLRDGDGRLYAAINRRQKAVEAIRRAS